MKYIYLRDSKINTTTAVTIQVDIEDGMYKFIVLNPKDQFNKKIAHTIVDNSTERYELPNWYYELQCQIKRGCNNYLHNHKINKEIERRFVLTLLQNKSISNYYHEFLQYLYSTKYSTVNFETLDYNYENIDTDNDYNPTTDDNYMNLCCAVCNCK